MDDRHPSRERGDTLTAREVARLFEVHPQWVFDHARQLGARRTGEGCQVRLVFDAYAMEGLAELLLELEVELPAPDEWVIPGGGA